MKWLGFINLKNNPHIMSYYNDIAEGYDELYGEEQLKKLNLIREKSKELGIDITRDTKLLDVGCGTGISTDFWNCDAAGIDPSLELIKQNKHHGKKSKLIQASAEEMPFPDDSFDIVISITAIHNFGDIEKGLQEIKRVGRNYFALSFLKRSEKAGMIKELIEKIFDVKEIVEEEKDLIVFALQK